MSVELRFVIEGECDHGPKSIDEPRAECAHHLECCWGRVEHPDPRPDRNEVGHLMLVGTDYVQELLANGPLLRQKRAGRVDSVTSDGERLFAHVDYYGKHWTWELFEAHFADGEGPDNMLLGRWPD